MRDTKTCTGIGLVALDVIMNGNQQSPPKYQVGGSCGNVLTILSFLDWNSYPIARLAKNEATNVILEDFRQWNVNTQLLSVEESGSTPIIIHRISKDKNGKPKHRFEFKDPSSGRFLPTYKAVISKKVDELGEKLPNSSVYYIDRVSRSSIELARISRNRGALVVFEPTSIKDYNQFKECLGLTDVLKFSNDRIRNYHSLFPEIQAALEIETKGIEGLNFRFKQNNWTHLPAYDIDEVVDAAGAGDWCTAGVINKLGFQGVESFEKANKSDVENALKYGQALGAINCLFDGARGIMYNSELDFINRAAIHLQSALSISSKEIKTNSKTAFSKVHNYNSLSDII